MRGADPPHAALAHMLGRVGRLRGYATVLLSIGSLLLICRILIMPRGALIPPLAEWLPKTVAAIFLTIGLLRAISKFLARRPRWHTRVDIEHATAVTDWSARFGLTPPQVLVCRSRYLPPVSLRGWGRDVAIVLALPTSVRWTISPPTRDVHLAHELAHAWARDLRLYYWTRSTSISSVVLMVAIATRFHWIGDDPPPVALYVARVLLLAFLTLVAGRAYLRFREHVADVSAMFVADDVALMRGELINAADQTLLGRIIGTHPRREARLAMLFNPMLLFKSEGWSYLLFGIAVGFFTSTVTSFLHPVAMGAGVTGATAARVAACVSALLVAIVLPMTMVEQFVFRANWLRAALVRNFILLNGSVIGMLFLNPMQLIPAPVTLPARWLAIAALALVAAVIVTLACLVAAVTIGEKGDLKRRWIATLRASVFLAIAGVLTATNLLFAR